MESSKETGRVEAFSDGVFAIAVTLLILELKVPEIAVGRSLAQALAAQWPSYVAFLISFASIGIMWINHHRIFTHIYHSDHTLLILNLVLLLTITFIPFPTSVIAAYLATHTVQIDADQRTAGVLYNGTFLMMALIFNRLWAYASTRPHLLKLHPDDAGIHLITRIASGPLIYGGIFVVGLVNVPASLALNLLLAVLYALPGRRAQAARADTG